MLLVTGPEKSNFDLSLHIITPWNFTPNIKLVFWLQLFQTITDRAPSDDDPDEDARCRLCLFSSKYLIQF